jgi:hypothetical protein
MCVNLIFTIDDEPHSFIVIFFKLISRTGIQADLLLEQHHSPAPLGQPLSLPVSNGYLWFAVCSFVTYCPESCDAVQNLLYPVSSSPMRSVKYFRAEKFITSHFNFSFYSRQRCCTITG